MVSKYFHFSMLGSAFARDLCTPKAVDRSSKRLTASSFTPVTSHLTTANPAPFAPPRTTRSVWKYRGQAKLLCSGF